MIGRQCVQQIVFPPCSEAIAFFNTHRPTDWIKECDVNLRRRWLSEKEVAIKKLSPILRKIRLKVEFIRPYTRPFPKAPSWLYEPNLNCVFELVSDRFALSDFSLRIQDIIDSSVFGMRFGCDWNRGHWRIVVPKMTNSFFDLSAIHHEVGHVLVNGNQREQNVKEMVYSETVAMIFEYFSLKNLLNSEQWTEWVHYQEEVDRYHFSFFHLEMGLIDDKKEVSNFS